MTGTDRFQANAMIAAEVYGPIQGNFCNSVLSSARSDQFLISNFQFLNNFQFSIIFLAHS